jgi:hypothetical protein
MLKREFHTSVIKYDDNKDNSVKANNYSSNNFNKNDKMKQIILNLFSLAFLVFIFYKFIFGLTSYGLLGLIVSAIISFLISSFILNKFKFSNNKFIRLLQKVVVFNVIIIIAYLTCDYFNIHLIPEANCTGIEDEVKNNSNVSSDSNNNPYENKDNFISRNSNIKDEFIVKSEQTNDGDEYYSFKVKKSIVEEAKENLCLGAKVVFDNIVPNVGAGSAAGTAAAAMIKATTGMPPIQRAMAVSGISGITAAATVFGIEAGNALYKNVSVLESQSSNSDHDIDRAPSPDLSMINSSLEEYDNIIPLEVLLNTLFRFNVLELLLGIILL